MTPWIYFLDYWNKKLWNLIFDGFFEVLEVFDFLLSLRLHVLSLLLFLCLFFFSESFFLSFIRIILQKTRSKLSAADVEWTIVPTLDVLEQKKIVECRALVVFIVFKISNYSVLLLSIFWQKFNDIRIYRNFIVAHYNSSRFVLA
jgi:hypothetical protein